MRVNHRGVAANGYRLAVSGRYVTRKSTPALPLPCMRRRTAERRSLRAVKSNVNDVAAQPLSQRSSKQRLDSGPVRPVNGWRQTGDDRREYAASSPAGRQQRDELLVAIRHHVESVAGQRSVSYVWKPAPSSETLKLNSRLTSGRDFQSRPIPSKWRFLTFSCWNTLYDFPRLQRRISRPARASQQLERRSGRGDESGVAHLTPPPQGCSGAPNNTGGKRCFTAR